MPCASIHERSASGESRLSSSGRLVFFSSVLTNELISSMSSEALVLRSQSSFLDTTNSLLPVDTIKLGLLVL